MKSKDLAKLSKTELFAMLVDIEKKLEQIKSEPQYKRAKLETAQKKVKRCLCECLYCTDSKTITKTDRKNGEEYEYLIDDCGREVCPYLDFFRNQTQSEEEIEKTFKNLLNSVL